MNPDPPLVEIAIEPKAKRDRARLAAALAALAAEDASFAVSTDPESGQVRLKGKSEHHPAAKLKALSNAHAVAVYTGTLQVAHRETISRAATADHTYRNASTGEFARVTLRLERAGVEAGFAFVNAADGGAVPSRFIPGVEEGLRSALAAGIWAGFPLRVKGNLARRRSS